MAEQIETAKVDQASVDDGDTGGSERFAPAGAPPPPAMDAPPGQQGEGGEEPDGFAQIMEAFKEAEAAQKGETKPEPAPEPKPEPKPEPAKEEPKKEEPAKEEPAKDPEPEAPPLRGKIAEQFGALKAKNRERLAEKDAEIERLRAQVTGTPKTADVAPQLESLQKEVETLRGEKEQWMQNLERANLAASPRFQAKYTPRVDSAMATLKDAAGDNADQLAQIAQVPQGPHRKNLIDNAIADMTPVDQARVGQAIAILDQVNAEKNSELENHKQTIEILTAEEQAKKTQQAQVEALKLAETTARVLKHAEIEMDAFKLKEGDEAHNAAVAETKAEVELILRGEAPEEVIPYLPVLAAEGNYLKQTKVPALEAKVSELEATIAKLTGTAPSPAEGVKGGEKADETKPKTFMDVFLENNPDNG